MNGLNLVKAVRLNRLYRKRLGWEKDTDHIVKLLGLSANPGEAEFAQAVARWQAKQGLRPTDGIIGPTTWSRIKPEIGKAVSTSGVNLETIGNIDRYYGIINEEATKVGINPNLVRGIIAAESGGNPNSGKGTKGYKGLMQAETTEDQLDPRTSIRAGVNKYLKFRESVSNILSTYKIDPQNFDQREMINVVMRAYNAGPATVAKAIQYAKSAGMVEKWKEPEFYQRSLLYYGAYSVSAALKGVLKNYTGEMLSSELGRITGMSSGTIRLRYYKEKGWDKDGLRLAIIDYVTKEKGPLKKRDFTLEQIRNQISSKPVLKYIIESIEFKQRHTQPYIDKILRYMDYYDKIPRMPSVGLKGKVDFPSGQSLQIVSGPIGKGEEHYDFFNTPNPLLDVSGEHRYKKLSANFTAGDFARSGNKIYDKARIDPSLVRCVQAIRDKLGRAVQVTSGYRSYLYNKELYEKQYKKKPTNSRHSSGMAADIKAKEISGLELAKIAISACGCNIGIGLAKTYIHVDVRGKFQYWKYSQLSKEEYRLQINELIEYRKRLCS